MERRGVQVGCDFAQEPFVCGVAGEQVAELRRDDRGVAGLVECRGEWCGIRVGDDDRASDVVEVGFLGNRADRGQERPDPAVEVGRLPAEVKECDDSGRGRVRGLQSPIKDTCRLPMSLR